MSAKTLTRNQDDFFRMRQAHDLDVRAGASAERQLFADDGGACRSPDPRRCRREFPAPSVSEMPTRMMHEWRRGASEVARRNGDIAAAAMTMSAAKLGQQLQVVRGSRSRASRG